MTNTAGAAHRCNDHHSPRQNVKCPGCHKDTKRDRWRAATISDLDATSAAPWALECYGQRVGEAHSSAAMTLDVYADLFGNDFTAVADKLSETVGKVWARGGDEVDPANTKTPSNCANSSTV